MKPEEVEQMMRDMGFEKVSHVAKEGFVYARHVDEEPQHLTNGKSYLMLTANQATFLCQTIRGKVGEAEDTVIAKLEADLKRLDSRNWSMDTLALDTIVGSGKADEYQKSKRQQIVEDRRAAHALYAILANYKNGNIKLHTQAELDQAVQEAQADRLLDWLEGQEGTEVMKFLGIIVYQYIMKPTNADSFKTTLRGVTFKGEPIGTFELQAQLKNGGTE